MSLIIQQGKRCVVLWKPSQNLHRQWWTSQFGTCQADGFPEDVLDELCTGPNLCFLKSGSRSIHVFRYVCQSRCQNVRQDVISDELPNWMSDYLSGCKSVQYLVFYVGKCIFFVIQNMPCNVTVEITLTTVLLFHFIVPLVSGVKSPCL